MKENDIAEVEIEAFSNLGYGIARLDGMVVFIQGACPKDKAQIKITKVSKNYANAVVTKIITPSVHRVEPFCPLQKVCGACQMQFINYDYQLELKQQIVQDAISKIGGLEIDIPKPIPSPQIKEYRHKIQYPISQTKNSKRILAGYYKPSSHEIVNIKFCPIQPKICDEIIEYIRQNAPKFELFGYSEKSHCGDIRHVVIRNSSSTGKNLVTLVINGTRTSKRLNDFAQDIFNKFEKVSGVCVNFNSKKTNVILGERTELIAGEKYIKESILNKTFLIGSETFFQINPKSAENIFKYVKNYIKNNYKKPVVLDAYAGISAFGICTSDIAKQIVTIEENSASVELAKETAKLNQVTNIEINGGDAAEFFKNEKRQFDIIILDPPRKGCSQLSLDEALRLCKGSIVYVSCNPATLARDLKYLTEQGAKVESIQPFDMFCHTFHIENVAIIKI